MSHHYAIVAAKLVEQCLDQIQSVVDADEHSKRLHSSNSSLYDMKVVLAEIESHLFSYFNCIIEKEVETSTSSQVHEKYKLIDFWSSDLRAQVEFLQFLLKESSIAATVHAGHPAHSYYPRRSATDSLLFRLNVALQLCLVRIDDARFVICGERYKQQQQHEHHQITTTLSSGSNRPYLYYTVVGLLGATTFATTYVRQNPDYKLRCTLNLKMYQPLLMNSSKLLLSIVTLQWIHTKWSNKWMTAKLVKSTEEIEEWIRQWILVQSTPTPKLVLPTNTTLSVPVPQPVPQHHSHVTGSSDEISHHSAADICNSLDAARSRRLIEYALHETAKVRTDTSKDFVLFLATKAVSHPEGFLNRLLNLVASCLSAFKQNTFWHSQGELRFLMVKRAMDVFYASVGTAGNVIGHKEHPDSAAKWQLTLVTAAVASFYSVIGARDKAAAVTSSSESASYLIRNAWGMVSLPAVKNLSLQASRLIKGAAVADRIEICGIHCFILSSDPAPELAAAIKRSHRFNQRRSVRKPFATLSTIDEQEEHTPSCNNHRRDGCTASFVRSSSRRYRQRDVIFHLTGGGFFAHIHSTDLPYLLDWSAATGAVVICPEYALLPEHTFPVALNEVEVVYEALVSDEAVSVLGFETNRIIVTGESAGGNLAASLCVKICTDDQKGLDVPIDHNFHMIGQEVMDSDGDVLVTDHRHTAKIDTSMERTVRLPDALMLSCPVLNLSLEMSHSRVVGNDDPVLPSGLISAISDAYLPAKLGISKKDPLASPFYASNDILRNFPPTLLFASSNDPLLDDSVVFNQRLREHGVDSDLIAAHNLPHAYLGLGTAGFPEAKQIQEKCIVWLNEQFTKKEVHK